MPLTMKQGYYLVTTENQAGNTGKTNKEGLLKAFFAAVFGTGFSRIFGAVRDIAIAHVFGAGIVTDAFWVAYTVPSVFRRFTADEGLTGAIIPMVSQEEQERGYDDAKKLMDTAFTALIAAVFIITVGGILAAPALVKIFAYGFSKRPEQFELTVRLTRWLFPFVIFVSLTSYCEGLLNHRKHFLIPKLAPGIVSITLTVFALYLTGFFSSPVYALAAGLLVGGALHFVVQIPMIIIKWGIPKPAAHFRSSRFRLFLKEMGKVVLIGIFAQINIVILRLLASILEPGSVTYYWNANRLVDLFQGIVAVGIGSGLLPAISKDLAMKDWLSFRNDLFYTFRFAFFLLIPAAFGLAAFGLPVVSLLFRHGNFSAQDMTTTAAVLCYLIPFFLAIAALNIIKKAYFAMDDRNTLLKIGFLGILLTAGLGLQFVRISGIKGLAMALSISTVIQASLYFIILGRRLKEHLSFKELVPPMLRIVLASIPVYIVLKWLTGMGRWDAGPADMTNVIVGITGPAAGAAVYYVFARLLKIKEMDDIANRMFFVRALKRKKKKDMGPEGSGLSE